MAIDHFALSSIFDVSGDAVFGVRDGRTEFMNPRARAIFGDRDPFGLMPLEFMQAPDENMCFTVEIDGAAYSVSAACSDGLWLICLRTDGDPGTDDDGRPMPGTLANLSGRLSDAAMTMRAAVSGINERAEFGMFDLGDYSSVLYHQIFRIQRLAENLKVLECGKSLYLRRHTYDMAELIGNLVDSVNHFFAGKIGLDISTGGETLLADVDESRITQMVLNVLTNSISRMGEDSQVTVSLRPRGGSVVITVSDNCGGIPPEVLGSVFARYASTDVSSMADGVGIGLAAAQGIARAHGGTILLESREGVGTSVSMVLPRQTDDRVNAPEWSVGPDGMDLLLTGLSCVLGKEYYNEKYMD